MADAGVDASVGGGTRPSSPNVVPGVLEDAGVIGTSGFGTNSGKALANIFCGDFASSSLKGWPASDSIIYINLDLQRGEIIKMKNNSISEN